MDGEARYQPGKSTPGLRGERTRAPLVGCMDLNPLPNEPSPGPFVRPLQGTWISDSRPPIPRLYPLWGHPVGEISAHSRPVRQVKEIEQGSIASFTLEDHQVFERHGENAFGGYLLEGLMCPSQTSSPPIHRRHRITRPPRLCHHRGGRIPTIAHHVDKNSIRGQFRDPIRVRDIGWGRVNPPSLDGHALSGHEFTEKFPSRSKRLGTYGGTKA